MSNMTIEQLSSYLNSCTDNELVFLLGMLMGESSKRSQEHKEAFQTVVLRHIGKAGD